MSSPALGIVVCSRNRHSELIRLIRGLAKNYDFPVHLVVVDSSDLNERLRVEEITHAQHLNKNLVVEVRFTNLQSLPGQKQIGVDLLLLDRRIEAILFLDDDTYLQPESAIDLQRLLFEDESLVAISGVTSIGRGKISSIHRCFQEVFLLNSGQEGKLLSSGINIPVSTLTRELVYTEWLIGCSMWKSKYLVSATFPSNLPGSALYEDVLISQFAREQGKLAVASWITLEHNESSLNRPDPYLHARRNQRNRFELTKIPIAAVSIQSFWWSTLGIIIERLLMLGISIAKGNGSRATACISFLRGTVRGCLDVLFHREPC